MAEIRPAAATVANLPSAPRPSARAEAVRSAHAAFFQAALTGQAAAPAAAAPTGPVSAAASTQRFDPDAPAPARVLRPGSLVDLKV